MNKHFLSAQEVSEYMGIALPTAYKLIRQLNKELTDQGYLVISGRVSRAYFEAKVYGGDNKPCA